MPSLFSAGIITFAHLTYFVIQLEAESLHAARTKLEEELASAQVQYVNTIMS